MWILWGLRQPVVAYGVTLVWLGVMGALLLHAQPPVTGSDGATLQWRRPLSGQTFNAARAARELLHELELRAQSQDTPAPWSR